VAVATRPDQVPDTRFGIDSRGDSCLARLVFRYLPPARSGVNDGSSVRLGDRLQFFSAELGPAGRPARLERCAGLGSNEAEALISDRAKSAVEVTKCTRGECGGLSSGLSKTAKATLLARSSDLSSVPTSTGLDCGKESTLTGLDQWIPSGERANDSLPAFVADTKAINKKGHTAVADPPSETSGRFAPPLTWSRVQSGRRQPTT
jgi:hypothetical protein